MASSRLARLGLVVTFGAACNSVGGVDPPRPDLSASVDMTMSADQKVPGAATKCAPRQNPVRLSSLPGDHLFPRISFTGQHYIAAWNTETFDPMVGTRHRIDTQQVDGMGTKLGPNLPLSSTAIADASPPAVAPVPAGTVVAWVRTHDTDRNDVVVTTVDNNGQKLGVGGAPCDPSDDECDIVKVTDSGQTSAPYLARPVVTERTANPTETTLSLVWIDQRNYPCGPSGCLNLNDVYWKKIQASGTELVPERRLTPVGENRRHASPRMAFDGVFHGIVYRDDTPVLYTDFYFASVDSLGLISTSPTKIGAAAGKGLQVGAPDLVWGGLDYGLVSIAGSLSSANVVFQRLETNGVSALLPRGVSFDGVACTPTVAFNEEFYGIAWQTNCNQAGSALAFVIVDKEGVRWKPDGTSCLGSTDDLCGVQTIVPEEQGLSSYPELVWSGGHNFGLVWMERTGRDASTADAQVMFTEMVCEQP